MAATNPMRYLGYHDDHALPVKQKDRIVIPAGVTVRTTYPKRLPYVTKRKQAVTVHHLMPGQSWALNNMRPKDRIGYDMPEQVKAFKEFDALRESMRTLSGEEYAAAFHAYMNAKVHTQNPSVCWPGAGGYWCEVDVNDILDANGL